MMVAPNACDALVGQAVGALRRLESAPPASLAARAAIDELTLEWSRRPFTIGLAGDIATRTELIDQLCGGGMLERDSRIPRCAPIRVRRGTVTWFRATGRDGSCEDMLLPLPPPPRVPDVDHHAETLRAEVAAREAAAAAADEAVPQLVRVPPPRWAFWRWLVRWFLLLTSRRAIATSERAHVEHAQARLELAAAELDVPTLVPGPPDTRDQFFKRLSVLSSGMLAGRDVHLMEIEAADGPLPVDLEIIETTAQGDVDELVTLEGDAAVVAGTKRRLETRPELIAALDTLACEARALRLLRRASEVVATEGVRLHEMVDRAEIELRNRIARLENLRFHHGAEFVEAQVKKVSRSLGASIHAVLEHAGVHLSSELAQCATAWTARVDEAQTPDELKAAAAKIDEESAAAARRIGEETRILVVGGVGGCAFDLLVQMYAPLEEPGLPAEHTRPPRSVPAVPAVVMLPSLTNASITRFADELAGAGKWLAGLFRAIDTRRAELRDKVQQRAQHLREVAEAEMLDAEPRLRAALRETITRELSAAIDRRNAWVAQELEREQLAVDAERVAMRPLTSALEDAQIDARRLYALVAEREAPP